jgi:lysyl-tRNA synthetase class 2
MSDIKQNADLPRESEGDLRATKLAKLERMRNAGRDPYLPVRFDRTNGCGKIEPQFDTLEGQPVALAGRVMSRRDMGKAGFMDLQDESGRVQLYFKRDIVLEHGGEDAFDLAMELDLGDIIGISGTVFRTRTGQVSVEVHEWVLLALNESPPAAAP